MGKKPQQGKYANVRKKTINRTGNRGVNGLRENLWEILGRSPDPYDVYTEAHRDKGSRMKKEVVSNKWDNTCRTRMGRHNRVPISCKEKPAMRDTATSLK